MRWRDIRTALTVATEPAFEPVSLAEAKRHANIDFTDSDHPVRGFMAAARAQLVKDTSRVPVNTAFDLAIERFPEERFIEVPRFPLVATGVTVKSYDEDDVETTMSSSDYRVDVATGRIVLNDDAVWPSDLRRHNAGVIRFTAGGNGSPVTITTLSVAADGTVTATTSTAHGWSTGYRPTILGAEHEELNGTFPIVVTGATTFTYKAVTGSAATDGNDTGTAITARLLNVPPTHMTAMLMLIAHWAQERTPVNIGNIVNEIPQTYAALIGGADRIYAMA